MQGDMVSTVVIVLRNETLDYRDSLASAVSQSLREYLDFVDSGHAGNEKQERYISSNGTEISVMAVSSPVFDTPCAKPGVRCRPCPDGGQPLELVLVE